jgi:WD40 repeat protein
MKDEARQPSSSASFFFLRSSFILHPSSFSSIMLVLEGPEQVVTSLAYSPDGRTLAAGMSFGEVILWDPLAGHQVRNCSLHEGGALSPP